MQTNFVNHFFLYISTSSKRKGQINADNFYVVRCVCALYPHVASIDFQTCLTPSCEHTV